MRPKRSGIFLQNASLQHCYIRNQDLSNIVERPERLRAVNIGLAAAIAHLEELLPDTSTSKINTPEGAAATSSATEPQDELTAALGRLKIEQSPSSSKIPIIQSQATVDLLNNPAVKFIHGDIDGDVYLESLKKWAKESTEKIAKGESEIPEGYSQGDLYLCPESITAIEGALGTACEAVDTVIRAARGEDQKNDSSERIHRAFVAIRPPGHHCGEDTPSGFCFVNNVAVAAAHAHLKHGINRIVIFDIDLHHGNGTQSIVWQVNEETYRQKLEQEAGAPHAKPGAQIFYGSTHDILSYPCEDGKPELVQAASVSLHGAHGQHIENVHLQSYTSEDHFWTELYDKHYTRVFRKAEEFFDVTGGPGKDTMIFISCGMDACEHEYESMSRHNRKVPTGFYYQFARDACALSDKYAEGRLISVLEGGYSDRALTSGAMAHFAGLTDLPEGVEVDRSWWNKENLVELEKATKKRRGGRPSLPAPGSTRLWIEQTLSVLAPLDSTAAGVLAALRSPPPVKSMTLRDRSKKASTPVPAATPPPKASPNPKPKPTKGRKSGGAVVPIKPVETSSTSSSSDENDAHPVALAPAGQEQMKVKRVILRLGPSNAT